MSQFPQTFNNEAELYNYIQFHMKCTIFREFFSPHSVKIHTT